jgi:hypothetical protein
LVLQDVKAHIDRYEFSEAIVKLRNLINELDDKNEAYIILLKLLKENSKQEFYQVEKNYLHYLSKHNLFENMYEYCYSPSKGETPLSINLKLFKLESLWEVGKVKDFLKLAKILNTEIIDKKLFHTFEKFFNLVHSKTSKQAFLKLGKIIYLLEVGDITEYKKLVQELKQLFTNTKRACDKDELKILHSLNNILSMYRGVSPYVYYDYHFTKYLNALYQRKPLSLSGKELIEFVAINSDIKELYIILEMELGLLEKDAIFEYIKNNKSSSIRNIPYAFKNTKKILTPEISMARVDSDIQITKDDIESPDKYHATKILASKHIDELFIHKRVEISKLERDLVTQFEIEPPENEDLANLIISFIEMDMNHIALNLANRMESSTNKSYLMAQINFNICDYTDAIYYINSAINEFNIKLDESVPFLYIKARSFEALGKSAEAQNTYRKIASCNPSFMDIRSKLNL